MSGRQFRILALTVAACGVLALAGCAPAAPARSPGGTRPIQADLIGRAETPTAFLTVTTSPPVMRGTGLSPLLVRYPVATLQLRSIRTGRVIATLLRSLGSIGAVMTRSGSVIAVVDYGCRSEVLRIDPETDRSTLVRVLPQSTGHPALSPDGSQLAYLTYPASQRHGCDPVKQPASPVREEVKPGGFNQFLPNVLAVVNLATGATVRAATSNPGQPPSSPAWSPDGTTIAVTSLSDRSIVLLSAAHPDFASAPQIRARPSCAYSAVTWIAQGLIAVCNRADPALPPYRLVRLSPAGRQLASWRLPGCIDGIEPFADATLRHVLVEAYIGYGNGPPCGIPHPGVNSLQLLVIRGSALDTVAVFGQQPASELEVTGW
jgi:WD40-like Beta Propeller Repeat